MIKPLKRSGRVQLAAQAGQAMLEYLIIAGILAAAMFVVDVSNGKTVAQLLADGVRAFYRSLSYFISLP